MRPYVRLVRSHKRKESYTTAAGRKRSYVHEVKPYSFRELKANDGKEWLVWSRTGAGAGDPLDTTYSGGVRVYAKPNDDGTYDVWKRNGPFDFVGSPGPSAENPNLEKEFGVTKEKAKEIGDRFMEEEFFWS